MVHNPFFYYISVYTFLLAEESPAAKELRALIREHLSEEIDKLKLDVEQQIKNSEEVISQKLQAAESDMGGGGGGGAKKAKSPNKSAKGKKK